MPAWCPSRFSALDWPTTHNGMVSSQAILPYLAQSAKDAMVPSYGILPCLTQASYSHGAHINYFAPFGQVSVFT